MQSSSGAENIAQKAQERRKRRVFIVDDHAVVRNGLAELINQTPDLVFCGDAASAQEAIEKIQAAQPEAVILDLVLGDMNGLELLKKLKDLMPELPILVLSMHDEAYYAERCLRAGAMGYIMKKEAIEQVEDAVRTVLEGKVYLSKAMSERFLLAVTRPDPSRAVSPVLRLTDREFEVLECIGQGMRPKEIARKLRLSVKTIETYQAKLKEKLNLEDNSKLFQYALHWAERQ
jgi:DNA-binding NarL/FixJ family response regulator